MTIVTWTVCNFLGKSYLQWHLGLFSDIDMFSVCLTLNRLLHLLSMPICLQMCPLCNHYLWSWSCYEVSFHNLNYPWFAELYNLSRSIMSHNILLFGLCLIHLRLHLVYMFPKFLVRYSLTIVSISGYREEYIRMIWLILIFFRKSPQILV